MKINYIRVSLLVIMITLTGCLEATFQLADESRLPKWFVAPDTMDRSYYNVQMELHSTIGGGGGKDVFKLYEKNKFFHIKKYNVTLSEQPHIQSVQLKPQPEGVPKGYPRYKVITLNDITDIVELRKMEPIFYMTDNPEVWKKLGVEQK